MANLLDDMDLETSSDSEEEMITSLIDDDDDDDGIRYSLRSRTVPKTDAVTSTRQRERGAQLSRADLQPAPTRILRPMLSTYLETG